jgi:hypothetical protein
MSEFETALRESLRHRAGDPIGWSMPPGTKRRVKGRQLFIGGAGASIAVAAVLVAASILTARVDRTELAPGTSSDPFGSLPNTWPTIVAGDPADAYIPAADEAPVGEMQVLYSGTVADAGFSFVGYLVDDGATGRSPCLNFTGPSPRVEKGMSIGVCAPAPVGAPVPAGSDLDLAGAGSSAMPEIEANFGFVSVRVSTLRVELSDGSAGDVPILPAPDGWIGIRPFLFFPPAGLSGTVVALSDDGTRLASAPMCVNEGVSHSCHMRVRQLEPMSPIWPEVRPGADGTPYVDHVEGEQVVGEKIPILHGEVSTPFTGSPVAYSLVVWQSAGGTNEAGAWVDLFVGYRATEDPSTVGFDAVGGGVSEQLSDLSARAPSRQVFLVDATGAEEDDGEHLIGLAGLVTTDVARLEIRSGVEIEDVALVADPTSDDRLLFVAFPPLDPTGEVASSTLVALGADGSEMWSTEIRSLLPPHVEAGADEMPERSA